AAASSSADEPLTLCVTAFSTDSPPSPSPVEGAIVLRPRVGLSPTSPQHAAGARMLPKPSVACAIGSMRAPTAAAAPPLLPPEMRLASHGLRVAPCICGSHVSDRPSSH